MGLELFGYVLKRLKKFLPYNFAFFSAFILYVLAIFIFSLIIILIIDVVMLSVLHGVGEMAVLFTEDPRRRIVFMSGIFAGTEAVFLFLCICFEKIKCCKNRKKPDHTSFVTPNLFAFTVSMLIFIFLLA